MKRITKISIALLMVFTMLLTVSCEATGKRALVGKWEASLTEDEDSPKVTFEFSDEGKYTVSVGGNSFEGSYEVEDDVLTLYLGPLPIKYGYSIKKRTLTLTAEANTSSFGISAKVLELKKA